VEVSEIRLSVHEIKSVLTSKRVGQADLRELWLRKQQLRNQLRILDELDKLRVF